MSLSNNLAGINIPWTGTNVTSSEEDIECVTKQSTLREAQQDEEHQKTQAGSISTGTSHTLKILGESSNNHHICIVDKLQTHNQPVKMEHNTNIWQGHATYLAQSKAIKQPP